MGTLHVAVDELCNDAIDVSFKNFFLNIYNTFFFHVLICFFTLINYLKVINDWIVWCVLGKEMQFTFLTIIQRLKIINMM